MYAYGNAPLDGATCPSKWINPITRLFISFHDNMLWLSNWKPRW